MIKLGKTEVVKLQAIKAGPISSSELTERFGTSMGLKPLIDKGLITENNGIYKITELGREICPTRVKNMPPAVKSVTKKQPASLVTLQAAPPIRTTLKTESENDMTQQANDAKTNTPTALLMLQCIGAYPGLTVPEISKIIERQCGPSYIPSYIDRGHVVVAENASGKKTYSLLDGMTAQEVYNYREAAISQALKQKNEQISKPEAAQEAVPEFTASAEDKDYVVNVSSASEMLNAVNKMCAQATIEMLGEHAHLVINPKVDVQTGSPKPDEAPKRPKIRFAITSEHTLIICNASFQDIELSQEDTAALVEFIESASLILPVDSGFRIGGATI